MEYVSLLLDNASQRMGGLQFLGHLTRSSRAKIESKRHL